jgi:two-component system C4-dicarboxylate transport response regulator DctD
MANTTAKASEDSTAPGRVLLVDDQPEVRRVVRRTLATAGYLVVEAWNGRVAIELARETTFDLVISDVRMPDMDGLDLLAALHELDANLPVVLTSGSPGPPSVVQTRMLGAFAFLEKPVPFDTMRETARRAIELRRGSVEREPFEPFASLERIKVARPEGESGDGNDDED